MQKIIIYFYKEGFISIKIIIIFLVYFQEYHSIKVFVNNFYTKHFID